MSSDDTLDGLPSVEIEIVDDRTSNARCDEGFLTLRRLVLQNRWVDATSEPYRYDVVEREALDAVAIVLEANGPRGPVICLRSALRPPMAFRKGYAVPLHGDDAAVRWEVPAGLVEPDEKGAEGVARCAARETLEEVGLELDPREFSVLGPSAPLSPGVLGESIHFMHALVDPSRRGQPTEDGSPVEAHAVVRFVALSDALAATRDGRVADVKTEVAIRRLAERRGLG